MTAATLFLLRENRSYILQRITLLSATNQKLNPEDLLVTAISSCHMLSYLYLCSLEGIVITAYIDNASGIMIEEADGSGKFKEVTLKPNFNVAEESMVERAIELHHKAHEICYIANSVNFEVKCLPTCKVDESSK
jgi:organic hydroperoxide reductase OsmC/OhrA